MCSGGWAGLRENVYDGRMISVVVRVERGVEALAVTLSALVPAVAQGLVGDAVVLARERDESVARVADAVGATLVVGADGGWRSAASVVRRNWVLCLADGDVPAEGWIGAVDRFIAASPPERGFGRLARRQSSWRERLARVLVARHVRAGDLVRRELLLRGAPAGRPVRICAAIERDAAFG